MQKHAMCEGYNYTEGDWQRMHNKSLVKYCFLAKLN